LVHTQSSIRCITFFQLFTKGSSGFEVQFTTSVDFWHDEYVLRLWLFS
jgi:hypothetical protein